MKDLLSKKNISADFQVDSAATSSEELGNPVYPAARAKLLEHGIDPLGKRARRLKKSDYDSYDMLIGMDRENLYYIERIVGKDRDGKVSLLMDYTDRPGEVSDPWYTRDFERAFNDIYEGCQALIEHLAVSL